MGRIYNPEDNLDKGYSHASVPVIRCIKDASIIVLFSARNNENKSILCEVEVCLNTLKPISKTKVNLLEPGFLGSFDEDGVMVSDIFNLEGVNYVTYIGWNRGVTVPFRNAIGIAEYKDGHFKKLTSGPILDRSIYDLCFVASNCVIKKDDTFIMYYLSCMKWEIIEDKLTHRYNIKIAESSDGINWRPTGKTAIDFKHPNEYAISVPRVQRQSEGYNMWYSYRGSDEAPTYRIGYAESIDGIVWERKDEVMDFEPSTSGWDSEMLCYPYIFEFNKNKYMLYNGNGYGKTGFGLAILKK